MRFAFVHPFMFSHPRGIERYVWHLTSALRSCGHEVVILTWRANELVLWQETDDGVTVLTNPVPRYYAAWRSAPWLAYRLWQGKYDMVFLHFADYGERIALAMLHLLNIKIRYCVVLHFPCSQVPHRYETLQASGMFRHTSHVVAVSGFVAEEAQSFLSAPPVVITHGVDTERFRRDPTQREGLRRAYGIPLDGRVLLSVNALEERKGVQWVIRALAAMLLHRKDLHYIVVGDGVYRSQLQRLAEDLEIARHVHFVGARTDTEFYYNTADMMLVLSRGEASSLSALEAMSCEVPVVASQHRPFDELIRPEWGALVDPESTEEVASMVLSLLNDDTRMKAMGLAGRSQILACHTWPHIARQYEDLVRG